jgi:hypothetical protein
MGWKIAQPAYQIAPFLKKDKSDDGAHQADTWTTFKRFSDVAERVTDLRPRLERQHSPHNTIIRCRQQDGLPRLAGGMYDKILPKPCNTTLTPTVSVWLAIFVITHSIRACPVWCAKFLPA